MAKYVEGFIIPIPKKNINAYKKMATLAKKIWLRHGALEYFETVGVDIKSHFGMVAFTKLAKIKPSETVIFAWIVYKSKAHQKQVMKKVMKDPELVMDPNNMPFDVRKMCYGGFKVLVEGYK